MTTPGPAPATGVEAFARQHRTQLLGGGAAAVVLFALWRRRSSAAAAAQSSTTGPQVDPAAAQGAAVAGYAAAGGGGLYSSGVTDFYDAVQPTLESIQTQINKLTQQQALPGVPVSPTPPPAPAPVPGPANPILKITPPAPTVAPARTYQVQAGDSLSKIAGALKLPGGTSTGWQALYNANRGVIGSNPNLIRPGQTLTVPS